MNRSIIIINTEKKSKSYLHGFYTSHVIVMYNTPPFPPTINDFPYARKNNTPPSSPSWKPMQTPALLGGSSHTSLPSASRMAKKLKPFQVFFPFFFFFVKTLQRTIRTNLSFLHQEGGSERVLFPRLHRETWRPPAAPRGGGSPGLTLSGCHSPRASRTPGGLPGRCRSVPDTGTAGAGAGRRRSAHTQNLQQSPAPQSPTQKKPTQWCSGRGGARGTDRGR